MRMYDVIEKKRDGGELTDAEIDYFVSGYVAGGYSRLSGLRTCDGHFLQGHDRARDSSADHGDG